MRKVHLPLLTLLVIAVLVLPMCGCAKKPIEPPAPPTPTPPPPAATTAPAPAAGAAGEAKWMENPKVADIPDAAIKGMVNGVAFEAKTVRVVKGDGKSKLEIMDKAADKPTGMVSDATEVKLEFVLEPGKPGEFVKAMADKDPTNTDGWYSYQQKDGSPMTMNSDWSVALKIDSWTLAKDPADASVLGTVKGRVFLVFKDDPKTFVAGTFEGPYYQ